MWQVGRLLFTANMVTFVLLLICVFSLTEGFLLNPRAGETVSDIFLYTRKSGKDWADDWKGQLIPHGNDEALKSSNFNPNLPTKFFIHGWLGSEGNWYILEQTDAFLTKADMNVFVVDWQRGSNNLNYEVARNRTREVGKEVADFITFLARHGLSHKNVHVIGHSLGGQTVGYVGMNLQNPKIARITGLDPAEIMFDLNNKDDTLDPSDADFVDVIHSSWISTTPKGHVDFYPNNGDTGHMMAINYFTESINSKCKHTAFKCASWEAFIQKGCENNDTNTMGYYASLKGAQGKLYLQISDDKPYCPV